MMNILYRIAFFAANADAETLQHSSALDRYKYFSFGVLVILTATFACAAGWYACSTFLGPDAWWVAPLFSLMWGLFIFNLDRLIVGSMRLDEPADQRLKSLATRGLIAILLSVAITDVLALKVFEPEIQEILDTRTKAIEAEIGKWRERIPLKRLEAERHIQTFNPSDGSVSRDFWKANKQVQRNIENTDQLIKETDERLSELKVDLTERLGPQAYCECGAKEFAKRKIHLMLPGDLQKIPGCNYPGFSGTPGGGGICDGIQRKIANASEEREKQTRRRKQLLADKNRQLDKLQEDAELIRRKEKENKSKKSQPSVPERMFRKEVNAEIVAIENRIERLERKLSHFGLIDRNAALHSIIWPSEADRATKKTLEVPLVGAAQAAPLPRNLAGNNDLEQPARPPSTGLLINDTSAYDEHKTPAAKLVVLGVFTLILVIELSPVLAKAVSRSGHYEVLLEYSSEFEKEALKKKWDVDKKVIEVAVDQAKKDPEDFYRLWHELGRIGDADAALRAATREPFATTIATSHRIDPDPAMAEEQAPGGAPEDETEIPGHQITLLAISIAFVGSVVLVKANNGTWDQALGAGVGVATIVFTVLDQFFKRRKAKS